MKRLYLFIPLMILFAACESIFGPSGKVTADFDYTIISTTNRVVFTNKSENAAEYLWDFGDSTSSKKKNPEHEFECVGFYPVSLTASNRSDEDTFTDTIMVGNLVRKPNIYIYPENDITIDISLNFPRGGQVIKSIPDYGTGWSVHVNPQGIIDETYDYLFYESVQPDVWQRQTGWCVDKESLNEFFVNNMKDYGFSDREINDFIEYWIPLLKNSEYYLIYPQIKSLIDPVIELDFSIQPQNVNRLIYRIKETDLPVDLEIPDITAFNRDGFTVVEWGVITDED